MFTKKRRQRRPWDESLALAVVANDAQERSNNHDDDAPPQRWARYIAHRRGVLPGSYLAARDTTHPGRERYTVQLAPGHWGTQSYALANLDRISSGLDVPMQNLTLEPHPDGSPTRLRLTVMSESPIATPVAYAGPKVVDGAVLLGPYADGDGFVPWRLHVPGEAPNSGRACGGFILGGAGSGKSRLLELLAIGAMSTDWCESWFVEPRGGASSPSLAKHANRYFDLVNGVLAALENLIAQRSRVLAENGWTGFDPSPDQPILQVFIDEAPGLFSTHTEQWAAVAQRLPKVGGALVVASRHASLAAFGGSEALRSAVCAGNVVAMRADSAWDGRLLPGVDMDLMSLPRLPGYGVAVGRDPGRTAPFRAEYVADPAGWMTRYRSPSAAA